MKVMRGRSAAGLIAGLAVVGLLIAGVTAETNDGPPTAQRIVPDPRTATKDVPDAYERGCQVDQQSDQPKSCSYGDPAGEVTVALVGDSKALQWISVLDTIGKAHGWHIRTYTKSACSFTAASIGWKGRPYSSCTRWNANVMRLLTTERPDVVLTTNGRAKALNEADDMDSGTSARSMVDGLVRHWTNLTRAGVAVVVLRDNPGPTWNVRPVYKCVDKHRVDPNRCAFPRSAGERLGAGDAQLAAAKRVPKASVVELNDVICPDGTCPAVVRHVLVYRQGAHLTTTFVDMLTEHLERRLVPHIDAD